MNALVFSGALTRLYDCLIPPRCVACGDCGGDLCHRCMAALATSRALVRAGVRGAPPVTALGPYEGTLRAVVLALKFRRARKVGVQLGRWLGPKIFWPFEVVVPVPLHASRLRERGFNQAAEIARGIAAEARGPLINRALVRTRVTRAQSELDLAARAANVDGAFGPGEEAHRVRGFRVLLVDDVLTTGATARACASALRTAGARTIYLAAAAVRL